MKEPTPTQIEWAKKVDEFNAEGRRRIEAELSPLVAKIKTATSAFASHFRQFRYGRPYAPGFENPWALRNFLNSSPRKRRQ